MPLNLQSLKSKWDLFETTNRLRISLEDLAILTRHLQFFVLKSTLNDMKLKTRFGLYGSPVKENVTVTLRKSSQFSTFIFPFNRPRFIY